jgi:hypothetical protein
MRHVVRCLCGRRLAGTVSTALPGLLGLLLVAGTAAAQSERVNPRDPRVLDDYRAISQFQEQRLRFVGETSYFNDRPLRCFIELNFSADYPTVEARSKRVTNAVAAFKRIELGFERRGDPWDSNDVHAFVRLRVERAENGAPLQVERIVLDYARKTEAEHPTTARWIGEARDADGYGKISMPVDRMEIVEIRDFSSLLYTAAPIVAMTLPEIGEDRVYSIPHASILHSMPAFEACACAMRNPRVSHQDVMKCGAPRYVPPGSR